MPFVGSIIPKSIATPKVEKAKAKRRDADTSPTDEGGFRAIMDDAQLSTKATEHTENPKRIAENTSEDSADDKLKQVYYGPQGSAQPKQDGDTKPHLDLKG